MQIKFAGWFILPFFAGCSPAFAQAVAPLAIKSTPDPATLTMPKLDFTPSPSDVREYEKYFYFHREDTSFKEAYADIRECDALASGANYYAGSSAAVYGSLSAQYGPLGGAIGGAIGGALDDLVNGSAERRQLRRFNMRQCMDFKGYHRFGLSKALWVQFNFEEGNGRKPAEMRDHDLQLQALVASGPLPQQQEIKP